MGFLLLSLGRWEGERREVERERAKPKTKDCPLEYCEKYVFIDLQKFPEGPQIFTRNPDIFSENSHLYRYGTGTRE